MTGLIWSGFNRKICSFQVVFECFIAERDHALRLTAAKSSIGHAEPAAGSIGIAHTMSLLHGQFSGSLKHLRNINNVILEALRLTNLDGLAMPKQSAAAINTKYIRSTIATRSVQCVSSFAFQGTNAHVVLCTQRREGTHASKTSEPRGVHWKRRRHWYIGAAHQLCTVVTASPTLEDITFQVITSRATSGGSLSYSPALGLQFVPSYFGSVASSYGLGMMERHRIFASTLILICLQLYWCCRVPV